MRNPNDLNNIHTISLAVCAKFILWSLYKLSECACISFSRSFVQSRHGIQSDSVAVEHPILWCFTWPDENRSFTARANRWVRYVKVHYYITKVHLRRLDVILGECNHNRHNPERMCNPNHYNNINQPLVRTAGGRTLLVNAFPTSATRFSPWFCTWMLELKSWTALPNHMRRIRNAVSPSKKP